MTPATSLSLEDSDELDAVTDPLLTVVKLLIVFPGFDILSFQWLLTALAYLFNLQVFNSSFVFLSSLVN